MVAPGRSGRYPLGGSGQATEKQPAPALVQVRCRSVDKSAAPQDPLSSVRGCAGTTEQKVDRLTSAPLLVAQLFLETRRRRADPEIENSGDTPPRSTTS